MLPMTIISLGSKMLTSGGRDTTGPPSCGCPIELLRSTSEAPPSPPRGPTSSFSHNSPSARPRDLLAIPLRSQVRMAARSPYRARFAFLRLSRGARILVRTSALIRSISLKTLPTEFDRRVRQSASAAADRSSASPIPERFWPAFCSTWCPRSSNFAHLWHPGSASLAGAVEAAIGRLPSLGLPVGISLVRVMGPP